MSIEIQIIIWLVVAIIYLIYKIINYSKEKDLKLRVAYCVTNNTSFHLMHINFVEADSKYKIVDESEEAIAKDILQCFQNEWIQNYFNEGLKSDHKIVNPNYWLKDKAYFFIALSSFLRSHECDSYIVNSKSMYTLKSKKTYGSWGGELYDAIYELTEVGVVYHKIFYLAQLFCENIGWSKQGETERIAECLETKEIQISRM